MNKKPSVYATGIFATEKEAKGTRIMDISMKVDKFVEFLNNNVDAKGYVKISLWPKRETDRFGTHNPVVNEWRPENYGNAPAKQGYASSRQSGDDDLPF
jgi:hypothetical protein